MGENLLSVSDLSSYNRRNASMPVLSYLHQLFNVDQCYAYIHTLRWKDRPLQCPRCQSQDIDPWGTYHYRPGCKHSWYNGCKRTFNDLTHTMLHQSKRSLPHWILATFLLCLACSSRRIAREVGVHIRTSYRWCWWLRNAALSYEMERQLAGTVEADELYHTAGQKGQAHHGGKKALGRRARGRRKKREPGRGHYEKDRPAIIAWVSRQGAVVNHTQKEYARGDVHENRAECLFSLLKPYLRVFRGLSKLNLPGYVGFFQFLRNFRQLNAFEQAELILQAALDPTIASRAKKGEFVKCFDHFNLLQTAIN